MCEMVIRAVVKTIPMSPDAVAEAAGVLKGGGLVVFPTDTVYGIFVDPEDVQAVRRVYEVKGRDFSRPLQLLVANVQDIAQVAQDIPEPAWRAARIFLPGGLTLVLAKSERVPSAVVAGGSTVGVRVPDLAWCVDLLQAFGGPLAATSANRSGEPSPRTAEEAAAQVGALVDLVVDGGLCPVGIDSTVLDFSGDVPRLLRVGAISQIALEEVLGVTYRIDNVE